MITTKDYIIISYSYQNDIYTYNNSLTEPIYIGTGGGIIRQSFIDNNTLESKPVIYSIKRLSDKTILSIGDMIDLTISKGVFIIKFIIYKDFIAIYGSNDRWDRLESIIKISDGPSNEDYILNKECISINELIKELNGNHPVLKLNTRKRLEIAESLVKLVKSKIK